MPTILLTNNYKQEVLDIVFRLVPKGFNLIVLENGDRNELLEKSVFADYFIVSGRMSIDKEVIDAALNLKMIQRTGVGIDQIDVEYLMEKNIPLFVNKGVNSLAVAEHTLMLILSSLRKLNQADGNIRNGIWSKQSFGITTNTLHKKTVGIIGFGKIAENLVRFLQPFQIKTLYTKKNQLDSEFEDMFGLEYCKLDYLLGNSDIICLLCSLNVDTKYIINQNSIKKMKDGVVLINTGRGQLIDETALVKGLKSNKIKFAGLDVFENEPLLEGNVLKDLNNILLTPHIAGITKESFEEMYIRAFRNIEEFENNLETNFKVN